MSKEMNTSPKHRRALSHFQKSDPVIFEIMKGVNFNEWIAPKKAKRDSIFFQALCREVIGQQLAGKAANAINKRFVNLFRKGRITPDALLKLPNQTLRDVGMSWAKAKYVKNIAKAYIEKSVEFNKFHQLTNEEVISQLTTIKGVGNWTAEMFLIFTLGREDVFSFGDLGLKKGFSKIYGVENPKKEEVEKVVSKWTPYKSYGSIALWHCLDSEK